MTTSGYALFATALGDCGIAWRGDTTLGLQLPEPRVGAAERRLAARHPDAVAGAPPAAIAAVIARVTALLAGEPDALDDLELDWSGISELERRVYEAARRILPGSTTTYGELAARIGLPGGARAVGRALGRNPFPIVVPCHRVLAADGRPGGFSAPGGVATKLRMLAIEHAAEPEGQQRLLPAPAADPAR